MADKDQKPGASWASQQPSDLKVENGEHAGFPPITYGSTEGLKQTYQDVYARIGNPSPTPTLQQAQSNGGSDTDYSLKPVDSARPSVQRQDSEADLVDGDDELMSEESEEKEDGQQEQRPMTAAEIRQQKRKMKRFRLTHSQTRYLMSEFARFPHPDAARREKLSREIPGLSPRQVQVWFQNRRAKLKRLSAEDRERMMRSRVLPDTYALNIPLNSPSYIGPHSAGVVQESRMGRMGSLSLDTMQRRSEHTLTSPLAYSAGVGSIAFTPPGSATDTRSPTSTPGDFAFNGRPGFNASRRMSVPNLQPGSLNYPNGLNSIGGRMSSYERLRTSGGDAPGEALRSSMSYPTLRTTTPTTSGEESREGTAPAATQNPGHSRSSSAREMPPPTAPYGLGFQFDSMPNYQSTVHGSANPGSPVRDNGYRGGMSVPASSAPYNSYFEFSPPAYSTPQPTQYMPQFSTGSYSSPLASHPFGHTPHSMHSMMGPMNGEHTFGNRDGGSRLHRQDSTHSSDGGVALGSY